MQDYISFYLFGNKMVEWLVLLIEDLMIVSLCPTVAQGLSKLSAQKDKHYQEANP